MRPFGRMGVRAVSSQTSDGIALSEGLGTSVAVVVDRNIHRVQAAHIGAGADTADYTGVGVRVVRTGVVVDKAGCTAVAAVVHIVVGVGIGVVADRTSAVGVLALHLDHS